MRALEDVVEAAYLGALLQVGPHVARVTGAAYESDADPCAPPLLEAARLLRERHGE